MSVSSPNAQNPQAVANPYRNEAASRYQGGDWTRNREAPAASLYGQQREEAPQAYSPYLAPQGRVNFDPQTVVTSAEQRIALNNRPLYSAQDRKARAGALDQIARAHVRDARRYRNFGWIPVANIFMKAIESGSYRALEAETARYGQYIENSAEGGLETQTSENAAKIKEKVRSAETRLNVSAPLSFIPVVGWALSFPLQQKNIRKLRGVKNLTETGMEQGKPASKRRKNQAMLES